jgi:hypothetical protein
LNGVDDDVTIGSLVSNLDVARFSGIEAEGAERMEHGIDGGFVLLINDHLSVAISMVNENGHVGGSISQSGVGDGDPILSCCG